jgi:hypothetical protein
MTRKDTARMLRATLPALAEGAPVARVAAPAVAEHVVVPTPALAQSRVA